MSDEREMPPLGETSQDRDVAMARAAMGSVPVIGSVLAELVGMIAPNQRADRVEAYLRCLDARLVELEFTNKFRAKSQDIQQIGLLEDGAYQAAKSQSDERRARIAEIVARGLTSEQRGLVAAKRMLRLFENIDDDQVVILTYYSKNYSDEAKKDLRKEHLDILPSSSRDQRSGPNTKAINSFIIEDLINLRLIERDEDPHKGLGRLDPVRLPRWTNLDYMITTPLGDMLLAYIGIIPLTEDPPYISSNRRS